MSVVGDEVDTEASEMEYFMLFEMLKLSEHRVSLDKHWSMVMKY